MSRIFRAAKYSTFLGKSLTEIYVLTLGCMEQSFYGTIFYLSVSKEFLWL